jgi:hypothetical protein
MRIENTVIKLLIESFTEECIEEMAKQKRNDPADLFNFGIGSADAAVRRVKTKWIEKLINNKIEEDVDNKVF